MRSADYACKEETEPPLKIGEILRYPNRVTLFPELDGRRNWYFETAPPVGEQWSAAKLDSGINAPKSIGGVQGSHAYIAIRSSPHRFGSTTTPWEDIHRPDQGYCRYFGDNKPGRGPATESLGNKRMMEAFALQNGLRSERLLAPPILVFEAVPDSGRVKGQVLFHGFGVITKSELIIQRSRNETFQNFVYEIALFDLSSESEELSWEWINARRNPEIEATESLKLAPHSWRRWVDTGTPSIPRLRRNVLTRRIVSEAMQRPAPNSDEHRILTNVHKYFSGKNHQFEVLAEFVVSELLREQGVSYVPGWITQGSGDGGFDFVGSVDLDPNGAFSSSRQVVLGQAKCEKLEKPTNGLHIARLAARLRRGWLGAYVTTSYFSIAVQREVLADRYPMMLVDGRRLAEILRRYLTNSETNLQDLLEELSKSYSGRLGFGDPEIVLSS